MCPRLGAIVVAFSPQGHERRTAGLRLLKIGMTEGIEGRRVGEALGSEEDYRRTGNEWLCRLSKPLIQ